MSIQFVRKIYERIYALGFSVARFIGRCWRIHVSGDPANRSESIELRQMKFGPKLGATLNSKPTLLNRRNSDAILKGVLANRRETCRQRHRQKVSGMSVLFFSANCSWEVV